MINISTDGFYSLALNLLDFKIYFIVLNLWYFTISFFYGYKVAAQLIADDNYINFFINQETMILDSENKSFSACQEVDDQQINPPDPQDSILSNIIQIEDSSQLKEQILSKQKLLWHDRFQSEFSVTVIQTDFESMTVLLHYGNFQLKIAVLYTNISQKLFELSNSMSGAFGSVKFCKFEGQNYAIKWIKINNVDFNQGIENVYKQYFLSFLAEALEAGPRMTQLFGYDIVVSKNMAFFSMEKCELLEVKNSIQLAQVQLLENLKKLHTIKVIHLDIKPGNISFSPFLNKYVFIDFGLSKIIKESMGQKTKILFSGTFSFCSKEMKSCYILNKPMPVDLYQNDLCCLQKSIKWLEQNGCFNLDSENIEAQNDTEFDIVTQLVLLLRLKFYIEAGNCDEILKLMEKSSHLPKSVYSIFINSTMYNNLSSNLQIQPRINLIRSNMCKEKELSSTSVDKILYTTFCQENQKFSSQKIIPIFQLLSLQMNKFKLAVQKVEVVYRLFLVFDPFQKNDRTIFKIENVKGMLISKIYQMRSPKVLEQIFFYEKIREVLIFFYETLKNLKNLKTMISLRFLFILIENQSYVQKLEDEIIQLIEKPTLKMLKIAEFSLFRDRVLEDFDHRRKQEWKHIVKNLRFQPQNIIQLKIKELVGLLLFENIYFCYEEDFKKSVIEKIIGISHQLTSPEEKQAIYNIKYLYFELSNIPFSGYTSPPRGLGLKVYSRYFKSFQVRLQQNQEHNFRMFLPLGSEFFKAEFFKEPPKDLIFRLIDCQIQIFREKSEYNSLQFYKSMVFVCIVQKESFFYFVRRLRQIIQNQSQYNAVSYLLNNLKLIHACLSLINNNKIRAIKSERINQEEEDNLLSGIEFTFKKILNSKNVKQILQKSKDVKIRTKLIEVEIYIYQGKEESYIKLLTSQIFQTLSSLPSQYPHLLSYLTRIFAYFSAKFNEKKGNYQQNFLHHIAQSYVSKKQYYVFQKLYKLLGDYITIRSLKGETDNLPLILAMFEHFREGKRIYYDGCNQRTVIYTVQMFRRTLNTRQLVQVYEKIKLNKLQCIDGLYGYFVFQIFLPISQQINQSMIRRQIIKTTLCLSKMPRFFLRKLKSDLLQLSNTTFHSPTKRKSFIRSRSEGKIMHCEVVKELQSRRPRKLRQSTLKALGKIFSKLKKYNTEAKAILQVKPRLVNY